MPSIKPNYFIFPIITLLIMVVGGFFTTNGMIWYKAIKLPPFTPSGLAISIIWHIIFALTTIAVMYFWNTVQRSMKFWLVMFIFALNGLLNGAWSYLFFFKHLIGSAAWDAALLCSTVIILILLLWPLSRFSAWLLVPYALWTAYATLLNVVIWMLNC